MTLNFSNPEGSKVIIEKGKKILEFPIQVEAISKNLFGKIDSWRWSQISAKEFQNRNKKQENQIITDKNQFATKLRLGEPVFWVGTEATDNQGINVSGGIQIPRIGLWSKLDAITRPDELNEVVTSTNKLSSKSIKVPLKNILSFGQRNNQSLQNKMQTAPDISNKKIHIETQNVILFTAFARYFPFQEGQINAESENEVSQKLNALLHSRESSLHQDLKNTIFGSEQPLRFEWEITIKDINDKPYRVKRVKKNSNKALKLAKRRKKPRFFLSKDEMQGDRLLVALPEGIPFIVYAKVKVSDLFGQSHTTDITSTNFEILNVQGAIEEITRIKMDSLNKIIEDFRFKASRTTQQTPFTYSDSNPINYYFLLDGLRKEFLHLGDNKVSTKDFQHLLTVVEKIYQSSSPT